MMVNSQKKTEEVLQKNSSSFIFAFWLAFAQPYFLSPVHDSRSRVRLCTSFGGGVFFSFFFSLAWTDFFFFFFFWPSTSLWGFYSETFIHRYSIPLTHAFTRLCMISPPSHVQPALCLFPLVTVCTIFDCKHFTIIIKHFGAGADFQRSWTMEGRR